jgi:hypothetical protein
LIDGVNDHKVIAETVHFSEVDHLRGLLRNRVDS